MNTQLQPRLRLEFLDGVRGLSALYVVLCHSYFQINTSFVLSRPEASVLPALADVLRYGHFAVGVFIVLSGFCLMLPIVRSGEGRLRGGFGQYLRRRARRILPPYFAALALSLLCIVAIPGMNSLWGTGWDGSLPALTPEVLVSHLLLVHNFDEQWMYRINYVFWSVAVEWQIYFLFPLLLLPLWQRWGWLAAAAGGFAVGIGLQKFTAYPYEACAWYVGLFALGMAAADLSFSTDKQLSHWREQLPWGWLTLAGAVGLGVAEVLDTLGAGLGLLSKDLFVGCTAACLLVWCACKGRSGAAQPLLVRLLTSPAAVGLGVVSYSLYLVHAPVLALVDLPLLALGWLPGERFVAMLLVAVPLTLAVAYLFHRLCERPFMSAVALGNHDPLPMLMGFFRRSRRLTPERLRQIGEQLAADTVTFLLAGPRDLAVHASIGLEEEVRQRVRIPIGEGLAGQVAASRQPLIVEDVTQAQVVSPILRERGLQALVAVPVVDRDRLVGVLHVGSTCKGRRFNDQDARQLAEHARQLVHLLG